MSMFGRRRKLRLNELRPGMRILEPIRGYRMKILVNEGEILSQKHIDQITEWDKRPGEGRLSLYTREVWTQAALGSARERPECDEDPYAAWSVQKNYRSNR